MRISACICALWCAVLGCDVLCFDVVCVCVWYCTDARSRLTRRVVRVCPLPHAATFAYTMRVRKRVCDSPHVHSARIKKSVSHSA